MPLVTVHDPEVEQLEPEQLVDAARRWWRARDEPGLGLALYRHVLTVDPAHEEALLVVARFGDVAERERSYETLWRLHPLEPIDTWLWYRTVIDERPRHAAGIAARAAADAATPTAHAIAASLLLQCGDYRMGLEAADRALDSEPSELDDATARMLAERLAPLRLHAALEPSTTERMIRLVTAERPDTLALAIGSTMQVPSHRLISRCEAAFTERRASGALMPGTAQERHVWQAVFATSHHDELTALTEWEAAIEASDGSPSPALLLQSSVSANSARRTSLAIERADQAVRALSSAAAEAEARGSGGGDDGRDDLQIQLLYARLFHGVALHQAGRYEDAWKLIADELRAAQDVDLPPGVRTALSLAAQLGIRPTAEVLDTLEGSDDLLDRVEAIDLLSWAGEHLPLNQARVYRGRFDEARRRFLADTATSDRLSQTRAYVMLLGGDGDGAADLLRAAPAHDLTAQTLLAHAAYTRGDYDGALRRFRLISSRRAHDLEARKMIVASLLSSNRLEEAFSEADALRKASPGYLPGQTLVAQCLERLCDRAAIRVEHAGGERWRSDRAELDAALLPYLLELVHRYRRALEYSEAREAVTNGLQPASVDGEPAIVGSDGLTRDEYRFMTIRGVRAVIRAKAALARAGFPFDHDLHRRGVRFLEQLRTFASKDERTVDEAEADRLEHLLGKAPPSRLQWLPRLRPFLWLGVVVLALVAVLLVPAWWTPGNDVVWGALSRAFGAALTTVIVAGLAIIAAWPFVQKLTVPGGFSVEKAAVAETFDSVEVVRTPPLWLTRSNLSSPERPFIPVDAGPTSTSTADRARSVDDLAAPHPDDLGGSAEMWFPATVPWTVVPPAPERPA